ncbi:transcriptional regulator FtsR [Streptomyces meridianus]|uniref:MerR family transcriptional regulator n=1 Tax=Streptomyces meridianus TaxID=2938945 RepID=A0ABT0X4K4_9ACTN|nr:MerR family transcriptional regulator [Streptomyces meridianus]MCM2577467.1 MerR family transcriptional regulator [Streptomyces meridianus]
MPRTPSGGSRAGGTSAGAGRSMSIGTVLGLLRDEFPEATISKIRFLEAEGLVEPERTPSGYRKFSPDDVDRLASVLRMQRDHYLPLEVIREHLDAPARGADVRMPAPGPAPELLDATAGGPSRIAREEFLEEAGAGEDDLVEWEAYGLVAPADDGCYDRESVAVARLVAEIGRFGVEPRHLRAVRAAADRQAGLVEQIVAPLRRHRNPQTRNDAEATARELAALFVRLHAAFVESALRSPSP